MSKTSKERVRKALGNLGEIAGGMAAAPVAGIRYAAGRLDGESHEQANYAADRVLNTGCEHGRELGEEHGATILTGIATGGVISS
jgi:hypothetical protein